MTLGIFEIILCMFAPPIMVYVDDDRFDPNAYHRKAYDGWCYLCCSRWCNKDSINDRKNMKPMYPYELFWCGFGLTLVSVFAQIIPVLLVHAIGVGTAVFAGLFLLAAFNAATKGQN